MMVMFIGSRSRDGDVYLEELGELIRVFPSFQKAFRRLHHQYQGCFGHPICTRCAAGHCGESERGRKKCGGSVDKVRLQWPTPFQNLLEHT